MLMMLCIMKIESLMKYMYMKKKIDIKVETTCIKFYTL